MQRKMWRSIRTGIKSPHAPMLILERRSFLLGMAASLVVLLAGFGAVSAVKAIVDGSRPEAIRMDRVYQSAIQDFEDLTTRLATVNALDHSGPATQNSRQEILQSRREELQSLDRGIEILRTELNAGALSPVTRARLRDLYSRKLIVLLDMIEQGEITI